MNYLNAGWARPATADKWHYFPESEMQSLCNRWFMAGERDDTNDDHKDNCAQCKRVLKACRVKAQ